MFPYASHRPGAAVEHEQGGTRRAAGSQVFRAEGENHPRCRVVVGESAAPGRLEGSRQVFYVQGGVGVLECAIGLDRRRTQLDYQTPVLEEVTG